jgi:hypothetical protein
MGGDDFQKFLPRRGLHSFPVHCKFKYSIARLEPARQPDTFWTDPFLGEIGSPIPRSKADIFHFEILPGLPVNDAAPAIGQKRAILPKCAEAVPRRNSESQSPLCAFG